VRRRRDPKISRRGNQEDPRTCAREPGKRRRSSAAVRVAPRLIASTPFAHELERTGAILVRLSVQVDLEDTLAG
jgi:hypothetical protein